MSYDLLLGIDTTFLAVLGGIVSAHAPANKKHKIIYAVIFIALGIVSLFFIVFQSKEATRARTESERENMQLRTRLDNSLSAQNRMQAQLDGIYLLASKVEASSEKTQQFALAAQQLISLKQRSLSLASKIESKIIQYPVKAGRHMGDPFWRFQHRTPEEQNEEQQEIRAYAKDLAEKNASLRKEFGEQIEVIIKEFHKCGLDTGQLRAVFNESSMFVVPNELRNLAAQIDDHGQRIQQ